MTTIIGTNINTQNICNQNKSSYKKRQHTLRTFKTFYNTIIQQCKLLWKKGFLVIQMPKRVYIKVKINTKVRVHDTLHKL